MGRTGSGHASASPKEKGKRAGMTACEHVACAVEGILMNPSRCPSRIPQPPPWCLPQALPGGDDMPTSCDLRVHMDADGDFASLRVLQDAMLPTEATEASRKGARGGRGSHSGPESWRNVA